MNAKEVCDALGISMMTLHRRIKAGELKPLPKAPGQKRHYRLAFPREEIMRLVQQG